MTQIKEITHGISDSTNTQKSIKIIIKRKIKDTIM